MPMYACFGVTVFFLCFLAPLDGCLFLLIFIFNVFSEQSSLANQAASQQDTSRITVNNFLLFIIRSAFF